MKMVSQSMSFSRHFLPFSLIKTYQPSHFPLSLLLPIPTSQNRFWLAFSPLQIIPWYVRFIIFFFFTPFNLFLSYYVVDHFSVFHFLICTKGLFIFLSCLFGSVAFLSDFMISNLLSCFSLRCDLFNTSIFNSFFLWLFVFLPCLSIIFHSVCYFIL